MYMLKYWFRVIFNQKKLGNAALKQDTFTWGAKYLIYLAFDVIKPLFHFCKSLAKCIYI